MKIIENIRKQRLIKLELEKSEETAIQDLPHEILDILNMSDSEKIEDCIEHTTSRDILNGKY